MIVGILYIDCSMLLGHSVGVTLTLSAVCALMIGLRPSSSVLSAVIIWYIAPLW